MKPVGTQFISLAPEDNNYRVVYTDVYFNLDNNKMRLEKCNSTVLVKFKIKTFSNQKKKNNNIFTILE